MELEKIFEDEQVVYQYLLNPEEVQDYTGDPKLKGWGIIEVYPETQIVHSYFFDGEERPTLREIAKIRQWNEEDFDKVVVWLHDREVDNA
ncbi:MAG: hypothetical protein ACOX4Q_05455 [Syntrophomonadales bacterium]|jgi:hypothetical protein